MKPFLKWAGNKYRIVEHIKAMLPPGKRLIEPFVGSGAVFLNTDYPVYLLTDANADLISLYQHLQSNGQTFIDYVRTFFVPENNNADAFYALRDRFNLTTDPSEKAALFVYLNRHCYNGLCRYNSKGEFNVPFGRYHKPYFPKVEMVQFCQHAKHAVFQHAHFVNVMEAAEPDDVIYCDPPYVPLSGTAKFTSYSSQKFGIKEQQELARIATAMAEKGVTVVISNHDTAFTRYAYSNATKQEHLDVQRHISSNGATRAKVRELIAVYSVPQE
jgi:DNA adenine methylase